MQTRRLETLNCPCHPNAHTSLTKTNTTPLALTLRLLIYLNFTQNEICCVMAGSLSVGLARRGKWGQRHRCYCPAQIRTEVDMVPTWLTVKYLVFGAHGASFPGREIDLERNQATLLRFLPLRRPEPVILIQMAPP